MYAAHSHHTVAKINLKTEKHLFNPVFNYDRGIDISSNSFIYETNHDTAVGFWFDAAQNTAFSNIETISVYNDTNNHAISDL